MNKDTMEAFPSLDTIKKETGCALQTIRKSILALEKEGAIKVKRKHLMYIHLQNLKKISKDIHLNS